MTKKIIIRVWILIAILLTNIVSAEEAFRNPRVGMVISKSSFQQRWGVTQMAAHGWAAVANLAGIPYDCFFLEEIPGADLSRYQTLILAQCGYVADSLYEKLVPALQNYREQGGSLIIDGPLALYTAEAQERDHVAMDKLLGIRYAGFRGNSDYRIKVRSTDHYINRMREAGEFVTQHLVNGLNILAPAGKGDSLLVCTNEQQQYPFLSTASFPEGGRLVLVSDFSTWAGAASFFRNVQPQVFYPNQLFNVMVRALHWTVYGDPALPFPAPQLSNAALTAIIRLDADASGNLDAQIRTINYLIGIARESGVVPVYAWVSSAATKAGWQDLGPLGQQLEAVGGEIGTHSRFHRIDREMNEQRWKEELDDAIREIEFNTADYGYPVGKVEWFINPGNTIHMDDYGQIARRFSFYMTHGFEQDMPLGYGNLTWFTGPHKNLVVVENTPSPDYQWFYDPTWSYTTQQITAYQEAIFEHMYRNIGKGVLYNQMWHDYSITSQPQYGKERIINKSNIAMYDALKARFATSDIYCPTPEDLLQKLRIMAQWDYRWESDGRTVDLYLNFAGCRLDTLPHFSGGMGVRIENTHRYIQSVQINGQGHPAFSERTLILPNLKKGENHIRIKLGDAPAATPRLTYVSKRMPALVAGDDRIEVTVLTRSKGRFAFYAETPAVVLNADWQEWNRKGGNQLRGYVNSDRNLIFQPLGDEDFTLHRCGFTLKNLAIKEKSVSLQLAVNQAENPELVFSTKRKIAGIRWGSDAMQWGVRGDKIIVDGVELIGEGELVVQFK
ncbi:MAG: hypothetical protein Kow0042_00450 [Calditrichia bacterium]